MSKVLFLVNHELVVYNFRLELVERLLKDGHEVYISSPGGEKIDKLVRMGCKHEDMTLSRRGTNPLEELKLLSYYKKLVKRVSPDIVFTYTIKPNIYGGMACKKYDVPYVANITGLGTAVEHSGLLQWITTCLYRFAFRKVKTVFFQNTENMQFFADRKISIGKHALLPGSGVNLERFSLLPYPDDGVIEFAFVARIMKEKGIDQYIDAAKVISEKYPNTRFHVCGFCEEEYEESLQALHEQNVVEYHGMVSDIRTIMPSVHCTVHPTYYPEGISNILLESLASGRPIITTDRSGCREVVEDGVNGFVCRQKDSEDLICQIEKFLALSNEERKQMGLAGRAKVESEFDRQIVVEKYVRELEDI